MTETTPTATDYSALAQESHDAMLTIAREVQAKAYAPYSNFQVGAAVLTSDGKIYRGCNVENASFGLTVCAERNAIFSAIADGHLDIVAVTVVTSADHICKPCGACRQVIAEFSQVGSPIIVTSACASGDDVETETINNLLPDNFTLL